MAVARSKTVGSNFIVASVVSSGALAISKDVFFSSGPNAVCISVMTGQCKEK